MKLKIEQLDRIQRECISQSLLAEAEHLEAMHGRRYNDIRALARRITHGEVLVAEYRYPENFEKCQN